MIRRIDNIQYIKIQRPGYIQKVKSEFRTLPLEREVEESLVNSLKEYGFTNIETQCKCAGGKADIVAGTLCIEVKRELTNSSIKGALGQVLLYAELTNKQPALAGYPGNVDDELVRLIRDKNCHLMVKYNMDWLWYPPKI
ncbi:MAG: hypothetical protein R3321_04585 [Nitrososphaeraceae archaeon]|nr:hypothetical protein [Nitrososphaeraceae archaeon]